MSYLKLILIMLFMYTVIDRICCCVETISQHELEIYEMKENSNDVTNTEE